MKLRPGASNAGSACSRAEPAGAGIPTFLVEVYASQQNRAARAKLEARCRAAAEAASREGSEIRYVRSIFVPKDETCFYLFEGPSADAVRAIGERAGLTPLRIVEAFD